MRGNAREVSLSSHAIDRFIERHRRFATRRAAARELERALADARYVEYVPADHTEIWSVLDGILIIVDDRGTVRSVLPREAHRTNRRPLYRAS